MAASHYRNNFQRSQSKVWWGNQFMERQQHTFDYSSLDHEIATVAQPQTPASRTPEKQDWLNRQGSPSSHKSQDSGFSDVDVSPNFTRTLSGYSRSSSRVTASPDKNLNQVSKDTPDKTPKKTISHRLNEIISQRSPSVCSSGAPTPPTVIRKPQPPQVLVGMPLIVSSKRLSFSAPSSPVHASDSILSQFDSFSYQTTSPVHPSQAVPQTPPSPKECDKIHDDDSPRASCRCSKDRSIRRSRVITKNSKVSRSLIGTYQRQYSEPLQDGDELDASALVRRPESKSLKLPKSILKTSNSDDNNNVSQKSKLPTYSDLFPTGTSTPIFGSPVQSPQQSLPITPKRTYENVMFTNET
jgi:hypothetical protein